jgi:hypothetical protein
MNMFGLIGKLLTAIGTLTGTINALAQTVADVNAGLRARLLLDAPDQLAELPAPTAAEMPDQVPEPTNGHSRRRTTSAK